METDFACVSIIDHDGWQLLMTDHDIATTLIAVASEDPVDWAEMMACWPRYSSRSVPEFASNLPLEAVDRATAFGAINQSESSWVVLDLVQKRLLTGKAFELITRDACFAMHTDENGDQHDPLSVHLPPWWELEEQTEPDSIQHPRKTGMSLPVVDRHILFGDPLVEYMARRVLEIADTANGKRAIETADKNQRNDLYPFTVEIHREWLMTPRKEIGGRLPREMLHGGVEWIDKLTWGQQLRFEQGQGSIVALPKQMEGYRNGPVGREEMALYFDMCRELLDAAWYWCQANIDAVTSSTDLRTAENAGRETENAVEKLAGFLNDAKTDWLNQPFEGGSAPAFILECSRRRVPRGAGVEIIGMEERQAEEHVIDCDCPICNMMADGMMGIGFSGIDGHHLELDEEFAFSMCETREEWEEQQREWAEMSASIEQDKMERQRRIAAGELEEDEFESVWSGAASSDAFPGGSSGNLQLAFLLAEIVSELEQANSEQSLLGKLNDDFSKFRNCAMEELPNAATSFSATLETTAEQYPDLVPRVADMQSRIEERLRMPVADHLDIDEFPF